MLNKKITVAEYEMPLIPYRHYLKRKAKTVNVIKRNDHRIKKVHFCKACGRKLTGYYKNGSYKVYCSYYSLLMPKKETYYICYNDIVCKNYLLKRQKTDMLTLYKVV